MVTPFNYTSLALTAQTLIHQFGRVLTVVVVDPTASDNSKPWRGNKNDPTQIQVMGVVFPGAVEEPDTDEVRLAYSRTLVHGLVRRGDSVALIAADDSISLDPNTIDSILDGGSVWHVIKVDAIQPGPVLLAYQLFIRR